MLARAIPIAALLVALALGLVTIVQWATNAARTGALSKTTFASVVDGETTAGITKAFAKDVPIQQGAIDLLNAVSFYVFGEARHGALIGSQGWLFSREEFERTGASPAHIDAALATIDRIVAELHARSIKVALLLLPLKADIYADRLGRYTLPTLQRGLYATLLDRLNAGGADLAPDLRALLTDRRATSDVFLHTDTHWTVYGAGQTADALCADLAAQLPHVAIATTKRPAVQHRGDLLNFLDLGPLATGIALTTETIMPVAAGSTADSQDALFGDAPVFPVTLVGSSYSANPLWSFKDQIEASCQANVLNVAVDGQGPFEPMGDYLQKLAAGTVAAPQAVVWEIPLRYLDDYSAADLAKLVP